MKNIYDIESIEGKSKIAQEILTTIEKLKSEVEKYEYIKRLSGTLHVKEEVLIAEFRKISSKHSAVSGSATNPATLGSKEPLSLTEKVILKFMLTNNKAYSLVKKNLKEEDFITTAAKRVVSCCFKLGLKEHELSSTKFIGTIEDKAVSSIITEILIDDEIPLNKELFKSSLIKLFQRRTKNQKDKIKEEIRLAEQKGDRERLKVLVNKYDQLNSALRNEAAH